MIKCRTKRRVFPWQGHTLSAGKNPLISISVSNNRLVGFNLNRRNRCVVAHARLTRWFWLHFIIKLPEGHKIDNFDDRQNRNAQKQSQNAAEVGDEISEAVKLRPLGEDEVIVFEEDGDSRAEWAGKNFCQNQRRNIFNFNYSEFLYFPKYRMSSWLISPSYCRLVQAGKQPQANSPRSS